MFDDMRFTCALCNDDEGLAPREVLDHFRLFHPDQWDELLEWHQQYERQWNS